MFRFTCNFVEYSKLNWNLIQNLLVLTDFFIFVLQVRGRFDNQRKQQAENLKIWKEKKFKGLGRRQEMHFRTRRSFSLIIGRN